MKRAFILSLAGVAAFLAFGSLVYAVLFLANASVPVSTTVNGLTPRRAWATASAGLALMGTLSGALSHSRFAAATHGRVSRGALIAVGAGVIAGGSGAINLATASGGPGSGNGVVGGAAALILGIMAVALGSRILVRARSAALR